MLAKIGNPDFPNFCDSLKLGSRFLRLAKIGRIGIPIFATRKNRERGSPKNGVLGKPRSVLWERRTDQATFVVDNRQTKLPQPFYVTNGGILMFDRLFGPLDGNYWSVGSTPRSKSLSLNPSLLSTNLVDNSSIRNCYDYPRVWTLIPTKTPLSWLSSYRLAEAAAPAAPTQKQPLITCENTNCEKVSFYTWKWLLGG
jgi:hypothetical protein